MRLELVDLPLVIHSARPRLERDFVERVLRQRRRPAVPAAGLLARNGTDPRFAVGPARRRSCRRALTASAAALSSAALSLALGLTLALTLAAAAALLRLLGRLGIRCDR